MNEKYILVYALSHTYDEKATDDAKKADKTKYEGYASRLAKGEDFKTIYEEINPPSKDEASIDVSELENTSSNSTASDSKAEETPKAKDEYATIIADEDSTSYASADFEAVEKMEMGEVKLIENEDKTGFTVYKKLDINSDPYYLENVLREEILIILKQEEFDKDIDTKIADLKVEKNSFAMSQLKVKKIKYPEA